ncbi:MAG: hypothetical protein NZV14_18800 [Bryobacteraceae bacterium]|nr:hypothetical protein [Bryobacteraceae bacterium]MDW8380215.1 hypothetical protein [Bryobacterales bacterium]
MPFCNTDLAYAAILTGLLLIYGELARPGTVLLGVGGAVLFLLGWASLAGRVRPLGLFLCLLGTMAVVLGAVFPWRGYVGLAGGVILAIGARTLTTPPVSWAVAWVLSAPFAVLSSRLLAIVIQARINKLLL